VVEPRIFPPNSCFSLLLAGCLPGSLCSLTGQFSLPPLFFCCLYGFFVCCFFFFFFFFAFLRFLGKALLLTNFLSCPPPTFFFSQRDSRPLFFLLGTLTLVQIKGLGFSLGRFATLLCPLVSINSTIFVMFEG